MAHDFQIQELIHQNEEGVLFQAMDKQTGHLVALQRFFLTSHLRMTLAEKDGEGETTFEKELEWLRTVEIPHLQRAIKGGFDSLDGTPFLVTDWVEGVSLAEGFEKGTLGGNDGEVFERQARMVLAALPMVLRKALALGEEEVLFSRSENGELAAHFWFSPIRFFRIAGGEEVDIASSEERLKSLLDQFPDELEEGAASGLALGREASSSLEAPVPLITEPIVNAPVPVGAPVVLKSAQPKGGGGLLAVSLIALGTVAAIFVWLLVAAPNLRDKEEALGKDKEVPLLEDALVLAPPEESLRKEQEVENEEEVASFSLTDRALEIVDEEEEAMVEVEESVVAEKLELPAESESPPSKQFSFEEEQPAEPKAELALTGEVEVVPEIGSAVVEADSSLRSETLSPDDLAAFRRQAGEWVQLQGTVAESNTSGSGKTWYLDFGDRRKQAFVSFQQSQSSEVVSLAAWEDFVGEEVVVAGEVEIETGRWVRGSGVKVVILSLEDISLTAGPSRETLEVGAVVKELEPVVAERRALGGAVLGERETVRAVFHRYQKKGDFVYLFFEGNLGVKARFEVGGVLSTRDFKEKMERLRGQMVEVEGAKQEDEFFFSDLVIHLENDGQFKIHR